MADNEKKRVNVVLNFTDPMYPKDNVQFDVPSADGLLLYKIAMPKADYEPIQNSPVMWDNYYKMPREQKAAYSFRDGGGFNLRRYTDVVTGRRDISGNLLGGNNKVVAAAQSGSNQQGTEIIGGYKPPGGGKPGQKQPEPNGPIVGTAKATVLSAIPGFDNTIPAGGQPALPMLTPSEMGAQYRPGITPAPRGFVQLPPMLPVDKDKQWENIYNFLHNRGAEGF